MKTSRRKTYNSEYYARNREQILYRRRLRKRHVQASDQTPIDSRQLSLFDCSNSELNCRGKFQRLEVESIINGLLVLLVLTNSYYLLSEAVEFYRSNRVSVESSVLAAVIVELLLLAFSVIQGSSFFWKIASKTALLLLLGYSTWSLCSNVLSKGYGAIDQLEGLDKKISRLEGRIAERNLLINENLKLRRVTMARRLTLEKDKLNVEVTQVEKERLEKRAVRPETQVINTWSMVALRLILQLSNIIMVHHLGASLRTLQNKSASKLPRLAPVFSISK